jgi:uncharacterized repeat protein (TIGR03847 family)
MVIELRPVDRITVDAVGPPGERVFYLQGRKDDRLVTLILEKQQVQLLAASVVEILSRIGKDTGEGPPEEAMELEEPLVPEWRAGRLSIWYLEERDLLVLEVEQIVPETETEPEEEDPEGLEAFGPELVVGTEEKEDEGTESEGSSEPVTGDEAGAEAAGPDRVRFWASREQMLSLARHGALVCAAGRPRCPLCGNPIDPEGHRCPALNGHRDQSEG